MVSEADIIPTETQVDNLTIEKNASSQLSLKSNVFASTSAAFSTEKSKALASSSTWEDLGFSATFTPPKTNSMILGFKLVQNVKVLNGDGAIIRMVIENDDTGAKCYLTNFATDNADGSHKAYIHSNITNTTYEERTTYLATNPAFIVDENSVANQQLDSFLGGSSYTVTFQGVRWGNASAETVFIDESVFTAYWMPIGEEVVTGWA